MVAPLVTHRETLAGDLLRALARAQFERIVVFRRDALHLGVGTALRGQVIPKPYTLTVTGPGVGDLACDCPAGAKGRACKHLAVGLFARKHHVYARYIPTPNPLEELFG